MLTREISPEEWIRFFEKFSKEHQGWIVTLEVIGPDIGDQEESTRLPLVGICADVKDRESYIEIIVGGRPEARLTHIVHAPKRVWFKQPEEPGDEAIEVESEDGRMNLVRFIRIPPEEVERQLP